MAIKEINYSMESTIKPYLSCSRKLTCRPEIECLLGTPILYYRNVKNFVDCNSVITWGNENGSITGQNIAERYGLPITRIEDGFLPVIGPFLQQQSLSLVIDTLGIYYDASQPSQLEFLIKSDLSEAQCNRTRSLIESWRTNRISKHNFAREYQGDLPTNYVLVVDQPQEDISIQFGLASASNFEAMLEAALAENPNCKILVKIYPETVPGKYRGFYNFDNLILNPHIIVLKEDIHPVSLIEHAQAVYCVTSQIGFEALLWGKKVRTFGMPFYAGWGLTHDDSPAPERRFSASLENLVHAVLIAYPKYRNPQTNKQCQIEELLCWIGLQKQMREKYPAQIYACGFSVHKNQTLRRFFQGSQIKFIRGLNQVPNGSTLLTWGNKTIDLISSPQATDIKILRLEDGFLRSVGLGVDLIRPVSWVVDSRGIYFDATRESDLEYLLQNTNFSPALLNRAQKLRKGIVEHGLTKYNVGDSNRTNNTFALINTGSDKRKIILVPGQVETDASITFGAPNIRGNMALLRAVREAQPDAYLIYKPHPDIVAGLRTKGDNEDQAQNWCDEIITNQGMDKLLLQVDEVHVLTSLTGFEALMRGKPVTCYGQPFYAGWGLTVDKEPIGRRTRRLSLDELVAAVLILYPTYVSRITQCYITAEQALDELLAWRANGGNELPSWRKALRPVRRVLRPFLYFLGIR